MTCKHRKQWRMNINLNDELLDFIKNEAARSDRTMQDVMRTAIYHYWLNLESFEDLRDYDHYQIGS